MNVFDNKSGVDTLAQIILISLRKLKQEDKLVQKLIDEPAKSKYDMLYLMDLAKNYADKKAMTMILKVENFYREVK
jgi:predicted negative regulator of RcsB-dependent stress response